MKISSALWPDLVEQGHLVSIHGRWFISLEALEPYEAVNRPLAEAQHLETQEVKPKKADVKQS